MSDPIFEAGGIRPHLVLVANALTGLSLSESQVSFEDLLMVDEDIVDFDTSERNSEVTLLRAASGNEPEVVVKLHYNRLYLPKLFELRSRDFRAEEYTELSQLLPEINARLATWLEPEDIQPVSFDPSQASVVTLAARPDSLYIFGEIDINILSSTIVL